MREVVMPYLLGAQRAFGGFCPETKDAPRHRFGLVASIGGSQV